MAKVNLVDKQDKEEEIKMANKEKMEKRLSNEEKQSASGGYIYAGYDSNLHRMMYYIPFKNGKRVRIIGFLDLDQARNSISVSESSKHSGKNVIECDTAAEALQACAAELSELAGPYNQTLLTDYGFKIIKE